MEIEIDLVACPECPELVSTIWVKVQGIWVEVCEQCAHVLTVQKSINIPEVETKQG